MKIQISELQKLQMVGAIIWQQQSYSLDRDADAFGQ